MIEFEYREKGQPLKFELDIDFISRGVRDMINSYLASLTAYSKQFHKNNDIQTEIAALKIEQPEGYKEKVKALELESKSLYDTIKGTELLAKEEEGINLIKRILVDNGIGIEHAMFNPEFWINNVKAGSIVTFLTKCYFIDTVEAMKNQKKNIEKMTA